MHIQEVIDLKKKLESDITNSILAYDKETGLSIDELSLTQNKETIKVKAEITI